MPLPEGVFGSEAVEERLNVRREIAQFRDDPLRSLLAMIHRPEHHELLIDEVARWEQAWRFYQQSFARVMPVIGATLRWSNGPYWTRRAGKRLTPHERHIERRYRELRPYLDLDVANFLIHSRILCDRVAGLSRYIVRGHPLPSFTSFADHRAFFQKGRAVRPELSEYGDELLTHTGWFEMPLKHVRDKYLIHTGPRHMSVFGQSTNHDLELILIVPDGPDRTRPLEKTKTILISVRRLARQIHTFLKWFNLYGRRRLRARAA